MSFLERSFIDPQSFGQPADDLDGLLREFYEAEMPDPWPSLRPPMASPSQPSRSRGRPWGLFRSRLALAASVGLLVVGQLFLSGTFRTDDLPASGRGGDDTAGKPQRVRYHKTFIGIERQINPDGTPGPAQVKKIGVETSDLPATK
jgi:hypothetical protein